jgi:hypothetical protein
MSIKFCCVKCGRRLKAYPELAGKTCKCTRCGQAMTVPGPSALPTAWAGSPAAGPSGPAGGKKKFRLMLLAGLFVALLIGGTTLAVVLYGRAHEIDRKVSDLAGDAPDARAQALLWLAGADPQDAHRAQVTAALEPLLVEGDPRGGLDPDLLLRAYLHWADQDNVPSLIRMVDDPNLPAWSARKTGLVMQALGRLQDGRAADVLAGKLSDPQLHDQAVDALKRLGRGAESAALDYLFAGDPAARQRAGDLLEGYGTRPGTVVAAARHRLESNDPQEQRAAAAWFADNPPETDAEKGRVARPLAGLLGDLSPEANGLALRGLKLWATKDCLPQLADFARRLEKAGNDEKVAANKSALIDVLAQFPDQTATEAIALQLRDPAQRGKASQALLKLGPVADGVVLRYLDHPDEGVRKEAESLCRLLKLPADRQLGQTLADVAGASKARSRAALQHLARLRPDEASRAVVSKALNAPLLDPDAGIRDDALEAVRVWATPDNTATLLKLLGSLHGERSESDARTGDRVAQALIAIGPGVEEAVAPLLRSSDALVRREACEILAEVGTEKSVPPLEAAGDAYVTVDTTYYAQTRVAAARVMARK